MKNIISFISFIIIFCTISLSSHAASPVWKIQGHGNTLFLAGTIHLLRASDYPLPQGLNEAYKKASTIVFETDLNAFKTPLVSQKLLASVLLPPKGNVLHTLSLEAQEALLQYSRDNNININSFIRYKPSFLAITLVLTELRKLNVNQLGVDDFFNQKAIKDQKIILGLETPEQQIQFLSTMGVGYENELILQTLDDIKDLKALFNDMILSWRDGNLQQIESFFIAPTKKQFPKMHQQILVKRNKAWLPQLKQYLTSSEIEMVMVGSAHLAGEDGLLVLLKNAGYQVSQLQ